jgi:AraC family transcriptional regulator of adaptative response/methylated-DNA-[protein]-cysteine methyltransferase
MVALADEDALWMLDFADLGSLDAKIRRLGPPPIIGGKTDPIRQIEAELEGYFSGQIREFKTPLRLIGSPFQVAVWRELQKIPQGETRSYAQIAVAIGRPTACRAAALANGANPFTIAIPCHRVINQSGKIGGYSGGVQRKEWLLHHERK